MLTGIAEQVFDDRRHQEFWISLIGIESGYNGAAKSHKGATGLGQLMPQYRADFGKGCGMTEVDVSDLQDDFTNAYLSACFFRDLIGRLGTVPLALTAYNSGPHSPGMRSALNGGAPSEETSKYVTRIWTKNQKVKTEITKETK
jgi:soluble lytic murein transglycosylase-like protein